MSKLVQNQYDANWYNSYTCQDSKWKHDEKHENWVNGTKKFFLLKSDSLDRFEQVERSKRTNATCNFEEFLEHNIEIDFLEMEPSPVSRFLFLTKLCVLVFEVSIIQSVPPKLSNPKTTICMASLNAVWLKITSRFSYVSFK